MVSSRRCQVFPGISRSDDLKMRQRRPGRQRVQPTNHGCSHQPVVDLQYLILFLLMCANSSIRDCSSSHLRRWNGWLVDLNISNLMMSAKTYEKCLNGISFDEHCNWVGKSSDFTNPFDRGRGGGWVGEWVGVPPGALCSPYRQLAVRLHTRCT